MNHKSFFHSMILGITVAAATLSTPASAGQAQNANVNVFWSWDGSNRSNVDQDILIETKGDSTYWAMNWGWEDQGNVGGYTGLQTDGVHGETAIFAIWNATEASGPDCVPFDNEGSGMSCRVAYPFETNRLYRLRVSRVSTSFWPTPSHWWSAWIKDTTTGVDTFIGKIRVGFSHLYMNPVYNFVEYFGEELGCGITPYSVAQFTQPAYNRQGGGVYEFVSTYSSWDPGGCMNGTVEEVDLGWTRAARVVEGNL